MKTFTTSPQIMTLILFSMTLFSFSTLDAPDETKVNLKSTIATFDGAEGNYYFFTNSDNSRAMQFENVDHNVLENYDLVNGDYVGKRFKIIHKNSTIKNLENYSNLNNANSSSIAEK